MDLWKAECYDENSQLQQLIANNFLNLLQNHVSLKTGTLLDIGCGNGRITSSLFKYYPGIRILGVDASVDMVDFAKEHFSNSQLMFHVDRAEELKTIPSESIDAIVSFSCLHWVFDHEGAFQRMYAVLKPEGWVGLMFAAETGFDDPIDHALAQTMQEEPWRKYFAEPAEQASWNIALPKNVRNQLETIGFRVVLMDIQNIDYYFKNIQAFQSWMLATFQQLKLLPEELQLSCAERMAELYLQITSRRQPLDDQCICQVDTFMLIAIKPES